jgi:hypothetical protein
VNTATRECGGDVLDVGIRCTGSRAGVRWLCVAGMQ